MERMRSAVLGAVGATVIAAAGCDSGEPDAGTSAGARDRGASATTTTKSTAPESTTGQTEQAGDAAVTPPGSELTVGDTAVVPYRYAGDTNHAVSITVTGIDPGDQTAFNDKFGAKSEGYVPYYITVTVTNVSGTSMRGVSSPRLRALGPDGRSTGAVLVGDLPGCENESAPREFTEKGASFDTCVLQAAQAGTTLSGVEYDDDTGGYDAAPLVWKTAG